MLYKYGGDAEAALLANANTGGENVHRGILLGALLGAAHGQAKMPIRLMKGLVDYNAIAWEIQMFVSSVCGTPPPEGPHPGRDLGGAEEAEAAPAAGAAPTATKRAT